jgi:glycosyltransferase involved in cell wall biosynthesis
MVARIGVVHSSLTRSLGGAEKLCLETINALKESGHQVDLITTGKMDQKKIKETFDVFVDVEREVIVPSVIPLNTIYRRFINWFFRDAITVSHLKKNYDLIVTTQPYVPLTFSDIIYMNDLMDFPKTLDLHYSKYKRGFWNFYRIPYETLINIFVKVFNSLNSKPIVLTNSNFTKQQIIKYLNVKPLVVYPPVDVENYLPLSRNENRKNIVLTISRLEEGKGLDLIPYIAARVENARFVIIGSLASQQYILYLRHIIKSLGVEDRIAIIPNVNRNVKENLLSTAKIYLHPRKYEYFGIAIVEAMAAGLIPLVHKSGAPWIDILNQEEGIYGYSYEDIVSCANYVTEIIDNYSKMREEIIQNVAERSKLFSSETFRKNIRSIIQKLL